MSKKNIRTSVDLTEFVQPIKECLTPIYGLKSILSAGILVFSKLPAEDREKAIAEANGAKNVEPLIIYSQKTKAERDKEIEKTVKRLVHALIKSDRHRQSTSHRRSEVKSR